MGRSLVKDLNAPNVSNDRQVDHRSISYIIFKNVKYTLGKKELNDDELPIKHDKTQ